MVWVEVVLICSLEVTTLQKKKKLLGYKLREMLFFSLSIYRGEGENKEGDDHRLS